jgi:hypothetical protein
VIEESTEKVGGREAESTLEEGGKHHNLICIRCGNIFTGGRMPLQHGVVQEKVVCDEVANLTFIRSGCLKQVRMQDDHSWKGVCAKARNRGERGDEDHRGRR